MNAVLIMFLMLSVKFWHTLSCSFSLDNYYGVVPECLVASHLFRGGVDFIDRGQLIISDGNIKLTPTHAYVNIINTTFVGFLK